MVDERDKKAMSRVALVGAGALIAWFAMLWFMFGDVL